MRYFYAFFYIVMIAVSSYSCAPMAGDNKKRLDIVKLSENVSNLFKLSKKDEKSFIDGVQKDTLREKKSNKVNKNKAIKFNSKKVKVSKSANRARVIARVKQAQKIKTKECINERCYPLGFSDDLKELDMESQKIWESAAMKFFPGEEHIISIKYLGVPVGNVILRSEPEKVITGKEVIHFSASLISSSYYRFIYSLDDRVDTYIWKKSLTPIKYTLVQRESGKDIDDLQLFSHTNLKTKFWYKRIKRGKLSKKHKVADIPYFFQDLFSSLMFLRWLPLAIGDFYRFPVVTKANIKYLKVKVLAYEQVNVAEKKFDAIKLKISTYLPGMKESKGDIILWYGRGKQRTVLKFKAKVKIGTISGELISLKSPSI